MGALVAALVGTADDIWELPAWAKLIGQFAAALIPVLAGVQVDTFTLPFLGHVDLGNAAGPMTVVGIVAVMNVVNFTDGVDGLAAGVCTIAAGTLAIIALSLDKACLEGAATCTSAGVLAAITAGASFGFLYHNFHPASIFMGDAGSNLLGLLLACVAIQGTIKTAAIVALFFPLTVLLVPIIDGAFVVMKRIKYRRPVYEADRWHLHHRLSNIGFSQRRTVLYLYGWTLALAALSLALRFVPYSDDHGHFNFGWSVVLGGFGLLALGASLYLVYVLEILKFTRFRRREIMRETGEGVTDEEIERQVRGEIETGEWEAVN
jgi:UDP-GlcNAc:undecaprenyl-phosphate GlcNAc-1-phosphate transferase